VAVLRIEIDATKCMGSGNCSFWAPATFDLGEDGIAYVLDPEGDDEDKIVLAGQGCPTQAIAIWREDQRVV
jgi:ferredoxin